MNRAVIIMLICLVCGASIHVAAQTNDSIQFGPGPEDRGSALDTIVAVVNDDVITRSQLDAAVIAAVAQVRQSGQTPPDQETLENQVLERLILNQLQLRASENNGVVVDDQTINAAMERIARQNNITLSQLRQILEQDGYSFARFREQIHNELLTTRLRQKVVESRIQISEQEVENWLASNAGQLADREYHLAHILIALPEGAMPQQIEAGRNKAQTVLRELRQGADFQRMAVAVSDDRTALEGGDLGWRRADQIPSLFAEVMPELEPGQISDLIRSPSGFHIIKLLEIRSLDEQMITQTKARHILITPNELLPNEEAQFRLQRLRDRIVNGEDFAEIARANSDDTTSAAKGGDLGWVGPGELVPLFEREMGRLQPGEVSEPFQTQFGWHIVQVLERRQQAAAGLAQRAIARENLFRRKAEEEWELWLRRIRDEAYVEVRL
jgi:peptidyl-prolyl cis-trans isomerase SurA